MTSISLFELLSPIYHRRLLKREKVVRAFARESVFLGVGRCRNRRSFQDNAISA